MVDVRGLIVLVVFILILTALAPAIITSVQSNAFNSTGGNNPAGQLQNASASALSMYSLIEILYVILGVFGILAVVGIAQAKRMR